MALKELSLVRKQTQSQKSTSAIFLVGTKCLRGQGRLQKGCYISAVSKGSELPSGQTYGSLFRILRIRLLSKGVAFMFTSQFGGLDANGRGS